MENTDKIKIPQSTLNQLKRQIDLNKNKEEKPLGFAELEGYFATGEITTGQASKIKSFFDNYSPSDPEQVEKHNTYGGNDLRAFVNNQLQSRKTKSKNITNVNLMTSHPSKGTQTGREVDRLNKPNSLASTEPSRIATHDEMLKEEIERTRRLMGL